MTEHKRRNAVGVCLVALALGGSGAATAASTTHGQLPYNEVETSNDVQFVTGGIGIESQQRLDRFARDHDYNLKLVFALNAGNYVADVDVVVRERGGREIVQTVADGPFFFARLPAGSYTVEATYGGTTHRRNLQIGGRSVRTTHFYWPSDPSTDFTFARTDRHQQASTSRQ